MFTGYAKIVYIYTHKIHKHYQVSGSMIVLRITIHIQIYYVGMVHKSSSIIPIHIPLHVSLSVFQYMCVCVCVCAVFILSLSKCSL